ncbi:hypothetical protein ACVGVM_20635 [Pseudonocardia bannensis]|nr:hypothetical protein [Pseudonocardia bannensis]
MLRDRTCEARTNHPLRVQEIDRDPMRLYRHAPSKDALLDGIVELVLA